MGESKLKNIKAIGEMLEGRHRFQTRTSVSLPTGPTVESLAWKLDVGELIYDEKLDGTVFTYFRTEDGVERAKGRWNSYEEYLSHKKENENRAFDWVSFKFRNCDPNNSNCERGFHKKSPKIERLIAMTGMCLDCYLKYETRLKIEGKYDDYVKTKMRANIDAYVREQEQELARWEDEMRSGINVLLNSYGDSETFRAFNPDTIIESVRKEWEEFKQYLYNGLPDAD